MWEGPTLGPTQKKPKVNLGLVKDPTQWGLGCFCLGQVLDVHIGYFTHH
jgi:hypothetical protein